ncbi:MAG TPA: ATP-binding protein [Candidatus Sumerlaeota bacterium]|nr:ATP-binding protein [Candidatus Sumerlaeota bacterium]HPK03765.1 ATP-binding protein [Candidatus Sumerlaeota bacterium]
MTASPHKPDPAASRRCLFQSGLLLFTLLLITLGLWQASNRFVGERQEDALRQRGLPIIQEFDHFMSERVNALRQVANFYAYSSEVRAEEFLGFTSSVMSEAPGIVAILSTDREGIPIWASPPDALTPGDINWLTADPKLTQALDRARLSLQPAATELLDLPEYGEWFLVAAPVITRGQHLGFIVGIFQYQRLIQYLLRPDLFQDYRISIFHANRPVHTAFTPHGVIRANEDAPGAVSQTRNLAGQPLEIIVEPTASRRFAELNITSLIIVSLGVVLSLLLSFLFHRWQWRTLKLQSEAAERLNRLERTGLDLAEVRGELELILNSVDEGIIFYNAQLEPVQANPSFLAMFNMTERGRYMSRGGTHHEHMIQFLGSESKYWALFENLRRNPGQTYADELEVPARVEGRVNRTYVRRATLIHATDGRQRGVLAIYKDVTSLVAMDRVKDEFLSNVTHELRSPLASIKGFAETLRRDQAMPAETRDEFLSIIYEESTRLQDLIEELLDLRRLEARGVTLNPVAFDFRILVDDVIRSMRSVFFSKKVAATVEWTGRSEGMLRGDVPQLTRALRNLLVNAVKYSPEGGRISVRGHLGTQQVWVEIQDQGVGIAEADLPHIFDKFYRGMGRGRQKGTGLGLAIVKHTIELHGGHLGVRSEVGAGTTFRIELPRQFSPPVTAKIVGAGAEMDAVGL